MGYLDNTGLQYVWNKIKTFVANNYVAKVSGKGLSTNDYTTTEKNKLAGLSNYSLPVATTSTLGGVISGGDITIDSSGNVTVNDDSHNHKLLTVRPDNYKVGSDLPSSYLRGETIFFSNNPSVKFNNIQYCTIHTIKGYSSCPCIQFLYPYNSNYDTIYYRTAIYNEDEWREWKTVSVEGHTHTVSNITDLTASATELNYMKGVTSNVQTQFTNVQTQFTNVQTQFSDLKEGNLTWGNKALKGSVTPIGMALSEEHSGNKAAFINGNAIDIEYSTDGGVTYTDSGISATNKSALFTKSYGVPVGGVTGMTADNYTKLKTRITLTAQDGTNGYIYTDIKKLLIDVSTSVTLSMVIETLAGDSTTWKTYGTFQVGGWSGWNDIPLITTLGGSSSQKDRPWKIRFTFSLTNYSSSYSTTKTVSSFRIFGGNSWNVPSTLGRTGHMYTFDMGQNVTFPAKVIASTFQGNLTGTSTKATGDGSGNNIETTYMKNINMPKSIIKSNKDANGVFTKVTYKRSDGTILKTSELSNADSSGNYTTQTVKYYKLDGSTLDTTEVYTITYDDSGDVVSEILT